MPICAPASDASAAGTRTWIFHGLALGAAAVAAAAAAYVYRRPAEFRARAVGVIPARFASSRFDGKPLALILGKPMIQVCAALACSPYIVPRRDWIRTTASVRYKISVWLTQP
jgi:hypothetical protein